nr:MAG: capsid protein [Partitiviridae sp.]
MHEPQGKNDPLYADAFFPNPLEELQEISKEDFFYPGCDGFEQLSHQIFLNVTARDFNYKRNIPECAHKYYLGMHLFARLLELHKGNRNMTSHVQDTYINSVRLGKYHIPDSFHRYLSGFGNASLPSGKKQLFALQPLPSEVGDNIPGYFGNIKDNAGLYTSYVCPAVLAKNILECIRFTETGQNPEWNLPEAMAYGTYPLNANCLGYSNAVRLTNDQKNFLSNQDITAERFTCYDEVPFHAALMSGVSKYLEATRDLVLVDSPMSMTGSQGQFVSVVPTKCGDAELLVPQSAYQIIGSLSYLGAGYQYYKIKTKDRQFWPNDIPEDTDPPAPYSDSIVWNQEHADGKLKFVDFIGTEFNPQIRGRQITQLDIRKP